MRPAAHRQEDPGGRRRRCRQRHRGSAAVRGPSELVLFDVAEARTRDLLGRLRRAAPEVVTRAAANADPTGFDIAINATPLGMCQSDPLPFDADELAADTLVADVIMKPPVTRLLQAASARGCRILEGRHMLDRQAPLIADYFGVERRTRSRGGSDAHPQGRFPRADR